MCEGRSPRAGRRRGARSEAGGDQRGAGAAALSRRGRRRGNGPGVAAASRRGVVAGVVCSARAVPASVPDPFSALFRVEPLGGRAPAPPAVAEAPHRVRVRCCRRRAPARRSPPKRSSMVAQVRQRRAAGCGPGRAAAGDRRPTSWSGLICIRPTAPRGEMAGRVEAGFGLHHRGEQQGVDAVVSWPPG